MTNFKCFEISKCSTNHAIKRIYQVSFPAVEERPNFMKNTNQQLTWIRLHSTSSILAAKQDKNKENTFIKKKFDSPLITLIDRDDKTSVLSLFQAERLAKRRDLKLVKNEDPALRKLERPVYKLLTGKEYFDDQMSKKDATEKESSGVKGEKTVLIGGLIEKHDLDSKVNSIIKWLKKSQRVQVTIKAGKSNEDDRAKVMKKMEEAVTPVGGRLLQVREKGDNIKFHIEPPKVKATDQETV